MEYKRVIDDIIEESVIEGIIPKEMKKMLINDQPRTPILYLVPKIHKDARKPPGRPIVSGVNSIFHPIATYVDGFLQNIVAHLKECLKDTESFISHIEHIDCTEITRL